MPSTDWACDASTHDNPVSTEPMEIRMRGPNRSTTKPWKGDRKVCSTMRIEKVTCKVESVVPNCACIGLVNKVHTYCGLEMAIMQTRPYTSCSHRLWRIPSRDPSVGADKVEVSIIKSFFKLGSALS